MHIAYTYLNEYKYRYYAGYELSSVKGGVALLKIHNYK